MSETSLDEMVLVGDEEVSIADIAGIDLSEVEAIDGFELWPRGTFQFRCKSAGLEKLGDRAAAVFLFECINVFNLSKDTNMDQQEFIGKEYRETQFITSADSLKFLKGFLQNTGCLEPDGVITSILEKYAGTEIVVPVKHTKDKKDPERVYCSIDTGQKGSKVKIINSPWLSGISSAKEEEGKKIGGLKLGKR